MVVLRSQKIEERRKNYETFKAFNNYYDHGGIDRL